MLFRRLVETNARGTRLTTIEGYAVSFIAHLIIIGGTLVASNQAPSSELAESFTPVDYFMARDRIAGSRPKQERITFMSTDTPGSEGDAVVESKAPVAAKPEAEPGPGLTEMASELADSEPAPEATGDSVMTALQVDSAVARYDDSAAPPYPPALLEKRIEGSVGIQYVVDTTGRADTASILVLSRTHEEFAASVRNTLPLMRFRPALMNGRKVRQLVQQMFAFRIDTSQVAQRTKDHKVPDKP